MTNFAAGLARVRFGERVGCVEREIQRAQPQPLPPSSPPHQRSALDDRGRDGDPRDFARLPIRKRQRLLRELEGLAQKVHFDLTGGSETLELRYQPSFTPAAKNTGQVSFDVLEAWTNPDCQTGCPVSRL